MGRYRGGGDEMVVWEGIEVGDEMVVWEGIEVGNEMVVYGKV